MSIPTDRQEACHCQDQSACSPGPRRAHHNTAVLLREAFITLNGLVVPRLAERGFSDVRPAHNAVFQYLDWSGTTVSTLASGPR